MHEEIRECRIPVCHYSFDRRGGLTVLPNSLARPGAAPDPARSCQGDTPWTPPGGSASRTLRRGGGAPLPRLERGRRAAGSTGPAPRSRPGRAGGRA